jgi:hypothetical protein
VVLPPQDRPFVTERFHTADLPDTPQRDYRIPATGWVEAPGELLTLGDDLGEPVEYKRRIHGWLLWRAGPPVGEARYLAVAEDGASYRFDLHGRRGRGVGPSGTVHERFRTWKEDLRDHPPAGEEEGP